MNIAIIDDDVHFSEIFYQTVDKFMKTLFSKYKIDIINSNFLSESLKETYDIVFLDIDLKDINGIDIGKKLMISSFSVRPFYFVRKSCIQQDLKIMYILLKKYLKENMSLLTFEFYGRKTNLFLKDIFFIESRDHDIILHTKNGEYRYRSTMKNILDALGTKTLVQFQKSYAVNLDYIMEINKGVIVLKNGEEYNIGRKFKDSVLQKYKEHFLR